MYVRRNTANQSLIAFLFAAGALLAGLLLLLWSMQERIAYQPQGPPYPDPNGTRQVEYRATDGQPLLGYVVGDPDTAAGVLLAFHGNADLAAWQVPWAEAVAARTGYAVFLAEYRGYMGLPGRPTYAGIRRDAHAAYSFLRDSLRIRPGAIALFGHSLGTAVAAELAAEVRPRALLLQSPFTSSRDMASRMVSLPLATMLQFVNRIPYDTRAHVSRLETPVWVIHGNRDVIVPARMGRSVFEAVRHKGGFVIIEGAGHNDVSTLDHDRYWKWLVAALSPEPPAVSREVTSQALSLEPPAVSPEFTSEAGSLELPALGRQLKSQALSLEPSVEELPISGNSAPARAH